MGKFIGVSDEVIAHSSQMTSQVTIIFGVDEEIDTLSSGLQIKETSTSHAESPSVEEDDTWNNNEEGEIVVAAGSGAIDSGTNLALTDVQAAITKGCGCLKFDHVCLQCRQLVEFQSQLEYFAPQEKY